MEWYEQGVGPAIQKAKADQTLFVVVIHGEDDASQSFLKLMDDPAVLDKLSSVVAIKILQGSESFKQFSQLYPVLLVPSMYFIDSASGVDLEVTGGAAATVESLSKSIDKAWAAKKGSTSGASSSPAPAPSPAPEATAAATAAAKEEEDEAAKKAALEERVANAKKMMEKRREQKEKEDEDVRILFPGG